MLAAWQLWLGRLNFTAVVFTVYLALRFVQEVPAKGRRQVSAWSYWLLAETWVLALLTLLTALVDGAEQVEAGHAITTFGRLFPCYLLHVVGYWVTALLLAFRRRQRAKGRMVRRQLTLIGLGMLATGGIAFVTNAVLPYRYADFRFCDFGTLSTVCLPRLRLRRMRPPSKRMLPSFSRRLPQPGRFLTCIPARHR